MLLTSSWLVDLSLLFIIMIYLVHKYISKNYDYWKNKGIFYLRPAPFFGNMYEVSSFKITLAHWQQKIYKSSDEPYVGIFVFHKPVLVIRSPELIKQVLIKNFNNFADRTILAPDHNTLLAHALFVAKNENWKIMRPKVTPAFTSGKLKGMFFLVKDVGRELNEYLQKNHGNLEARDLSAKFATEVIARTMFGINAHCFEDENCDFRKVGRQLFDFRWKTAIIQSTYFFMHNIASFLRLDFVDKDAVQFLCNVFWKTIKEREKTNFKGNDLIDILVELRRDRTFQEKVEFEGDKVVSQPFQFFAAGIETTTQTISFTLYELCINPEVQKKLRNEIMDYLEENKEITYENIKDLAYLEMCILETIRKYPVVPFLDRKCNTDFTIPGTETVIEKGVLIYIPLLGLQYDEKYFPEPNKYYPERFADKSAINQNGLYYLPFGEGPRICLGERLAMMDMKIALINIISQFAVEPNSATPIPLRFTTKSFSLNSDVGLPMKFVKLNQEGKNCEDMQSNNL